MGLGVLANTTRANARAESLSRELPPGKPTFERSKSAPSHLHHPEQKPSVPNTVTQDPVSLQRQHPETQKEKSCCCVLQCKTNLI